MLAAVGAVAALASLMGALALAGVFSDEEEPAQLPRPETTQADTSGGEGIGSEEAAKRPDIKTIEVGGRPTAIAAGEGAVWIADSFSDEASAIDPLRPGNPRPAHFALLGPAADVATGYGGVWFALPEQGTVERRDPSATASAGEQIPVEGFPSGIAAGGGSVWAVSESLGLRIDPVSGEVGDEIGLGGFGSGVAVGEGWLWVVVDNRELVRIDASTGEDVEEPIAVRDAFNIAVGDGSAWVVSASGTVTGIDTGSLEAVSEPVRVRGALDVAVGKQAVWVTSSDRTVTRLDPATGEIVGAPLPVGDEPGSVSVGEGAVWVANGGDGTVTRIDP
jgi:streptogramin lyase